MELSQILATTNLINFTCNQEIGPSFAEKWYLKKIYTLSFSKYPKSFEPFA